MKKVLNILRWIFGIAFLLSALTSFSTNVLFFLLYLILGIIIFPPASKKLSSLMAKTEAIRKQKNPERAIKLGKWSLLIISFILLIAFSPKTQVSDSNKEVSQSQPTNAITTSEPTSPPKPTNTPAPTATPIPKDINGFPMDYESVTITQIAKVPSAYNKKGLMFTCKILSFAKNDSGDASAINCSDPNNYSSVIQVGGLGWDFTKINEDDITRIYGLGMGASTGKNAFGGDIMEGIVQGIYINDLTSGYNNAK